MFLFKLRAGGILSKAPLIAYAGGFWSTNMGNSFYDLGCIYVLKEALSGAEVVFTQDQPGYYWQINGNNPKNTLNYIECIKPGYLVIGGPMISEQFTRYWCKTLENISNYGTKLILLSAGCISYDEKEKQILRDFMKKFKPYALISRDNYTYENYGDLACYSYDGICCAFFANDYFRPYKLDIEPYVIFGFDEIEEPVFSQVDNDFRGISLFGKKMKYNIEKKHKYGKFLQRLNKTNKKYQESFAGFKIVRTRHGVQPSVAKTLFRAPNTFVSDVPYDYLNLYANAEAVFSDRVHACVPALAFEKPVMFFSKTLRGKIFDRVGLSDIIRKPVVIDQARLKKEKESLLLFMKNIFKNSKT